MGVTNYRELEAWKSAMELAEQVYHLSSKFPPEEKFGSTNQLRRAAVSIPSNIAEGQGRRLRKQFAMFLRIARGSVQEVETQLLLASRLGFGAPDELQRILENCDRTSRIVAGLLRSIEVG